MDARKSFKEAVLESIQQYQTKHPDPDNTFFSQAKGIFDEEGRTRAKKYKQIISSCKSDTEVSAQLSHDFFPQPEKESALGSSKELKGMLIDLCLAQFKVTKDDVEITRIRIQQSMIQTLYASVPSTTEIYERAKLEILSNCFKYGSKHAPKVEQSEEIEMKAFSRKKY